MIKNSVSIIVPCYNAAKHIHTCLTSIMNQTFTDYELIFVNDGSSDETPGILDDIAGLSNRLRVLHKENGGVSSARNAALDIANGEYVTFVDVDDRLTNTGLDTMMRLMSDDKDVVFAGYTRIEDGYHFRQPEVTVREYSRLELVRELFAPTDYNYLGFPWAKLFRRSVIENHHIRFDEKITYNEDRLFIFNYLAYARGGVYTTTPVYEYYLHGGNAMAAIYGPNYWKYETDLDAFVKMNRIVPMFQSKEVERMVRCGTIASYRQNIGLNRQYGDNSSETNNRLRRKLVSAVPWKFRCRHRLGEWKGLFMITLKNIFK